MDQERGGEGGSTGGRLPILVSQLAGSLSEIQPSHVTDSPCNPLTDRRTFDKDKTRYSDAQV